MANPIQNYFYKKNILLRTILCLVQSFTSKIPLIYRAFKDQILISQCATCFQPANIIKFPIIIGGSNSDTEILSFDVDTSYNFVVGGKSSSNDIISGTNVPNPFVAYITSAGSISWSFQFKNSFNSVEAVKFDIGNPSNVVVALNNIGSSDPGPAIITISGGSIVDTYQVSYMFNFFGTDYEKGYGIDNTNDGMIYWGQRLVLSGQDRDSDYMILKFTANGNSQISRDYQIKYNEGKVHTLLPTLVETTYFAGGYIVESSNTHAVFSRIDDISGTPSIQHFSVQQGMSTSSYYYVSRMDYKENTYLLCICQHTIPSNGLIMIYAPVDTNEAFTGAGMYAKTITDGTNSIQVYGVSANGPNDFWIYCQVGTEFRYAKLRSTDYAWESYPLVPGQMYHAKVFTNLIGFYVGSMTTFNNIDPSPRTYSYSHKVGFIFTYTLDANSCVTGSYTLQTAVIYPSTYSVTAYSPTACSTTYQWYDIYQNQVLQLNDFPSGLSSSNLNSANYIQKNWCTVGQTLVPSTQTDQSYTVGTNQLQFTITDFTVTGCTDAVFTYIAQNVVATVPQTLPTYITFSNKQFTVVTSSSANAGTYSILVTGTVQNFQTATLTFTITIIADPCIDSIITPVAITTPQTFEILTLTVILGSASWTQSIIGCPAIQYALIDTLTNAVVDSIFSMASGSAGGTITVATSDPTKIKTWNLNLEGTVTGYPLVTANVLFSVIVQDSCLTATVSSTAISTKNYDILLNNLVTVADGSTWTRSLVSCPVLTYTLLDTSTNAAPDSIFIFVSTTGIVTLQTSDNTKKKAYSLSLTATMTGYSTIFATQLFIVNIIDSCDNVVMTKVALTTPQTYDIVNTGAKNLGSAAWSKDLTQCPAITYQIYDTDQIATADPIFYILANILYVNTLSATKVRTYNLQIIGEIIGTYKTYTTDIISFTVTITDVCSSATIISTPISVINYDILSLTTTTISSPFTLSITGCPGISITLKDITSGSEITPDILIFTIAASSFDIQTSDNLKKGTYNMKYYGQLIGYPQSTFLTFTVNIIDSCDVIDINTVALTSPQTYDIWQGSMKTLGSTLWTKTIGSCPAITYTFIDINTMTTPDAIFSNSGNSMTVSTNSVIKVSTYNLQLKGEIIGSYKTYKSKTISIQVDITDSCTLSNIVPQFITSPQYFDVINNQLILGSIASWTQTKTYCPTIVYLLLDFNNGVVPITTIFDIQANKDITVTTSNYLDSGTFNLKISAYITGYPGSLLERTFDVIVYACSQTVISPQTMSQVEYLIAITPQISYSFPDWTESIGRCGTFTYSLSVNPTTIVISLSSKTLTIFSINQADFGDYTVSITGILSNGVSKSTSFILKMKGTTNNPPYFQTQLKNQKLMAGTKLMYTPPAIIDDQGDLYTKFIMLGQAQSFVRYTNDKFYIEPSLSVSGDFQISITLQDQNPYNPKNETYMFIITVEPSLLNTTVIVQINTTIATPNITVVSSQKVIKKQKEIPKDMISKGLTAKISEMSVTGLMTITFSNPIIVPANFTSFDSSFLNIIMIPGEAQDISKLNFTWQIIDFQTDQMKIQLNFQNPLYVSAADTKDKVRVTFTENGFFQDQVTGKALPNDYSTSKACPQQMDTTSISAGTLNSIGSAVKSGSTTMLMSNFAINLIIGQKIYNKLSKAIYFNMIIRFILEGYLEFALDSLINLEKLTWVNNVDRFCAFLTIFITLILLLCPMGIAFFLVHKQSILMKQEVKDRAGSLYEGINSISRAALMYNALFVFRRLIFALTCVFVFQYPTFQIQALSLQSCLMMAYLAIVKPFEQKFLNKLELFNEICILIVSQHLYLFTSFVQDPELQYKIGWSIIVITCLNIGANMIIIIINGGKAIIGIIKILCQRLRKCKTNDKQKKYDIKQKQRNLKPYDFLNTSKTETILRDTLNELDSSNLAINLKMKKMNNKKSKFQIQSFNEDQTQKVSSPLKQQDLQQKQQQYDKFMQNNYHQYLENNISNNNNNNNAVFQSSDNDYFFNSSLQQRKHSQQLGILSYSEILKQLQANDYSYSPTTHSKKEAKSKSKNYQSKFQQRAQSEENVVQFQSPQTRSRIQSLQQQNSFYPSEATQNDPNQDLSDIFESSVTSSIINTPDIINQRRFSQIQDRKICFEN